QLLADGMSNADVATQLFISQETVKSHVRHILAKLEADTRTHAVAIAVREAVIDWQREPGDRRRRPRPLRTGSRRRAGRTAAHCPLPPRRAGAVARRCRVDGRRLTR